MDKTITIVKQSTDTLPIERIQDISKLILERGIEELKYKVSDFAVIRIDAVFDSIPKTIWLFNKDSEGQFNLKWLPSVRGSVSTSKHRELGSFLLQNRFDGGIYRGQKVKVNDISYYKPEAPGGIFDAVFGKIELSSEDEVQFNSLRSLLRYLVRIDEASSFLEEKKKLEEKDLLELELEQQSALLLDKYIKRDHELIDKLQATQRYIRETNALRIYPALDKEQTKIKDARVWDGILIIDGGPGTGKTTTLIQRVNFLTQKNALSERRPDIPTNLLQELDGEKGWLFISPTELLKSYLQNAMAEEGLKASNTKMKVWSSYLDELFRGYGLFQANNQKRSPFTKARNFTDSIFSNDWMIVNNVFNSLDQFILSILKKRSQKVIPSLEYKDLNFLRQKIENSMKRIETIDTWIELFQFLNSLRNDYIQEIINTNKELTELLNKDAAYITTLLQTQNNPLYQEIGAWEMQSTQEETQEENMEENIEESDDSNDDEDFHAQDFQEAVFKKVRNLIKNAAMLSLKKGYKIKDSQKKWIEKVETQLTQTNLTRIGELALIQLSSKKWLSGGDTYLLNSLPSFYKEFRRAIIRGNIETYPQIKSAMQKVVDLNKDKLHSDEMNFLFAWINRKVKVIANRFPSQFEESNQRYIQAYKNYFRYNVVVDEATDFSLIELLAMDSLTHRQFKSMTLCGDLMQRMTSSGLNNWHSFLDALDNQGEIHELKISYRQTPTLLRIAKAFYQQVTGFNANYIAHAKSSPNEPKPWIKQCEALGSTCKWLADRIIEIHTAYEGKTPSIAIFCINDDTVRQVTHMLKGNDDLFDIGINVQGIESSVSMIDASKVCIYNIKNIKGLEFEAVFFVDIDQLNESDPELLQKYLYVGISRAAFYLGITYREKLPLNIQSAIDA